MNSVSASLKAVSNVLMRSGAVWIIEFRPVVLFDNCCSVEHNWNVLAFAVFQSNCELVFLSEAVKVWQTRTTQRALPSVSFYNLLPHPGKPSQRKAAVCATYSVPWQVFLSFYLFDKCTGRPLTKKEKKGNIFLFFFLLSCKMISKSINK